MLAFLIFRLAGDPVELMVGEQDRHASADKDAACAIRLGLNDGLITQYVRFVGDAAQGDFGVSYRATGQKVLPLIAGTLSRRRWNWFWWPPSSCR